MVRTRGAGDVSAVVNTSSEDNALLENEDVGIKLRNRASDGSNKSLRELEIHVNGSVREGRSASVAGSVAGSSASTSLVSSPVKHEAGLDSSEKVSPVSQRPQRNAYRNRLEREALADTDFNLNNNAQPSYSASSQGSVRRSTRSRIIKYSNMNEEMFGYDQEFPGSQPSSSRKRRRSESESEVEEVNRIETRTTRRSSRYAFGHPVSNGHISDNDQDDMYSRIKSSRRRSVKRNFRQEEEEDTDATDTEIVKDELGEILDQEDNETADKAMNTTTASGRCLRQRTTAARRPQLNGESSSEDDGEEEDKVSIKKYHLRQRKVAPVIEFEALPRAMRRKPPMDRSSHQIEERLSRRDFRKRTTRRRRTARHGTSDSDSSSSDESHFQRKKANKMAAARDQCLPLNFKRSDLMQGSLKERMKIGSSLADIEPMTIDTSITFDSIGGLGKHLNSLKEMVVFPLLYPEVFDKFKVQVPRGVLFYGPPGTGKTLVARALANECSTEGKKVAFFMRKGADCMSKWVGESERQLRLLFDQAYVMRPSIIFFDEIDGIAPIRSTRQDQIHSSIVSTLLALMDGLDSRGEIIVIGATNRIEAIDPALRRPGRFDREFFFPLPSCEARRDILTIHTKSWSPPPSSQLIDTLADRTVGYCGADLKALCSEAVLLGLKRKYSQIYSSKNKLKLDYDSIEITFKEFNTAINRKIVPAAQRSVSAVAKPLPVIMRPLLNKYFTSGLSLLKEIFPLAFSKSDTKSCLKNQPLHDSEEDDEDEVDEQLLTVDETNSGNNKSNSKGNNQSLRFAGTFRPRLLVCGNKNLGQEYIVPALMQELEHLNHFRLTCSCSLEQLNTWFTEAIKRLPTASVLYCPKLEDLTDDLFSLLCSLLDGVDPTTPLLFIATSETPLDELTPEVLDLFCQHKFTARSLQLTEASEEERRHFFLPLFKKYIKKPVKIKECKPLEVLQEIPVAETRKLSDKELAKLKRKEEISLRQLRNFLREMLSKLMRDKRFSLFAKPVDLDEVSDYYDVIAHPMDLETMMFKIDSHSYETARQFLDDIELITNNALEYNPARDSNDRQIRHRACTLRDVAISLIDAEMDSDFEVMCQEFHEKRKLRGECLSKEAPKIIQRVIEQQQQPLVIPSNQSSLGKQDEDTEIDSVVGGDESTGKNNSPSVNGVFAAKTPTTSYKRKGKKRRFVRKSCPSTAEQTQDTSQEITKSDESSLSSILSTPGDKRDSMEVDQQPDPEASTSQSSEVFYDTIPVEPQVVISDEDLDNLLKEVVDATKGCTVDQLENLYWTFFRRMRGRIRDNDRRLLVDELKSDLSWFKTVIEEESKRSQVNNSQQQ